MEHVINDEDLRKIGTRRHILTIRRSRLAFDIMKKECLTHENIEDKTSKVKCTSSPPHYRLISKTCISKSIIISKKK